MRKDYTALNIIQYSDTEISEKGDCDRLTVFGEIKIQYYIM